MISSEPQSIIFDKRFLLGCLLLGLLSVAFWSGSRYPALNEKAMMGANTDLSALGFDTIFEVSPADPLLLQIVFNTVNWMYTNKTGMLFGLLFAALLMTLLPLIGRRGFQSGLANTLTGMAIGTPLGVCVNCAAPIAQGLRTAGARAETALAAMLSSPTLNIIVLTMLFALFPTYLAVTKVALTLGFIVIAVPILTRFAPVSVTSALGASQTEATFSGTSLAWMAASCEIAPPKKWSAALLWVGQNFGRNLWFIIRTTVPLMILAGFLGSLLITVVPFESLADLIPQRGRLFTMAGMGLVGVIGTFLPVPMAFDVIVVAILVQAGLPMKYAAILLFTLGIFSIYSFSIVWQSISKWSAISTFGLVVAVGCVAGVGAHYAQEWQQVRNQQLLFEWTQNQLAAGAGPQLPALAPAEYTQLESELVASLSTQALAPDFVFQQDPLSVARRPFHARSNSLSSGGKKDDETWFERWDGRLLGIDDVSQFSVFDMTTTYMAFRGIAAGDIHQDGWIDVLLTTNNGLALYANQQGHGFVRQEILGSELSQFYVVNAALVDLNNDGWLDIYLSTYRQGNYTLYNQAGRFTEDRLQPLPNYPEAITTAATTFGDVDQDGDLDIALGNWSIGGMTTNPLSFHSSRNAWLNNQGGNFSLHPLDGVSGETLSMLFTDFNQDGDLDLLVGNDFNPADTYYLGDGSGGFQKLTTTDGFIPHSTRWTMSLTTADVNNDLATEIYAVQISGGPAKEIADEQICAEYADDDLRQQCLRTREMVNAVARAVVQQDVSACLALELAHRDGCMAYYMLMTAIYIEKEQSYCAAFPKSWAHFAFLCNYHFDAPSDAVGLQPRDEVHSISNSNVFLRLDATGRFVDKTEEMGLTTGGWGWNAKFADLDLDEWQDLYLVSGYIGPIRSQGDFASDYFYQNREGQTFTDRTDVSGLASSLETLSYTYIDIDHDGDLDIISVPMFGPVWIYMNQTVQGNAIAFELRDHVGNHYGVGSTIIIHYGDDRHQMREIQAGGGYLSYDAPIAHFGLGAFDQVNAVEIIWSTGERSEIRSDFAAGASYIISREE